MLGRRFTWAALVGILVGLCAASSAAACTCTNRGPEQKLRDADAAIVGRLVEVVAREEFVAEFRYQVLRRYKGSRAVAPEKVISVWSATIGSACGLPQEIGRHYGLLLLRQGGRWRGSSCAMLDPRGLGAAARAVARSRHPSSGGQGGCAS